MMDKGCDLCHTPIGTAPFGTGNDFSRVTSKINLLKLD